MYKRFYTILGTLYLVCVALVWIVMLFCISRGWVPMSPHDMRPFPISMLMIAVAMGLLFIFVIIGMGKFVYTDARMRGMDAFVWMLVAIFVPYFVGLIAYLLVRKPLQRICPNCGKTVMEEQAFCPFCGAHIKRQCPKCQSLVSPSFQYCPNCGVSLPGDQAGGTAPTGQK